MELATTLFKYQRKFSKLRVDRSKGSPAPHKPILLLAVIEGVALGEIKDNKVYISPELVARFKDYWYQLVDDSRFTSNFSLPFYHLKSEGFWHLQHYAGQQLLLTSSHSIKSFGQLKQVIDHAYLDEELFVLLSIEVSRQMLKKVLMDVYFPHAHPKPEKNLFDDIIKEILYEPAASYRMKAEQFDEEEVFVRGGVFKREIPKIYNYTCAISGMRVITDAEIQMIDACHIVPFAQSHDDTITNGISLCPNLHRAFDRGLISLDSEYRLLVKPFAEQENLYSIKQFAGRRILLPGCLQYFPAQENLAAHRLRHNFS